MQINLTPDPSLLAVMVIFIINYFVVRRFFLAPVNAVLEAREADTRGAEQTYEDALNRFNTETARMEEQLHVARREASHTRERQRAEATAQRGLTVEQTQARARELVSSADATLSAEVSTARAMIDRDSESLARLAAEKILGRQL